MQSDVGCGYLSCAKPGESGNCTDIAFTKKAERAKAGIHSTMFACNLMSAEGKAFFLLDDGHFSILGSTSGELGRGWLLRVLVL
ncbi:hypothetical protein C2U70_23875 [Bradyrhizobium guangdongense]|nr:hypothetical protein C2U70_23875 [Bradyrhizobium guangdongense]